ncbi:hypothetical protein [Aquaspirillum serpens]|uniref:hypothetical protein n=1 Tax=Aquaspirillum serpens TaxID=190 RepID=UPI0003B67545|nr:hypothetical protein [Aquaspirillum serpens]
MESSEISKIIECIAPFVSVASFLVSIASAVFAKITSNAAKKANDINLHVYQKKIYDAFLELRMHMIMKSISAEMSEVSKFYYPAKEAEFYFSSEIAKQFQTFFDLCFEVADLARVQRTPTELSEATDKVHLALGIAKQLEEKIIGKITLV